MTAKTRKRTTPAKAKPEPEHSTYTLKQLERRLWQSFTAKCKTNGREVKWVMVKMITGYANDEIRVTE